MNIGAFREIVAPCPLELYGETGVAHIRLGQFREALRQRLIKDAIVALVESWDLTYPGPKGEAVALPVTAAAIEEWLPMPVQWAIYHQLTGFVLPNQRPGAS
jgi:hypothetical protein